MREVGIREAADILGVSVDTVRRRVRSGDLPARRVPMGKGYRWMVEVEAETPDDAPARDPREVEVATLRAQVAGLERLVETLVEDRDAWRDQANRAQLLAEQAQRLAIPVSTTDDSRHDPAQEIPQDQPSRLAWWRRLFG